MLNQSMWFTLYEFQYLVVYNDYIRLRLESLDDADDSMFVYFVGC